MKRVALLVLAAIVLAGCDMLPFLPRPALTEDQAIAIAREAAPELWRDEEVLDVRQVPYGEVANENAPVIEGERPGADRCVWFVDLGTDPGPLMGQGVMITIDCVTGDVIHVIEWIS